VSESDRSPSAPIVTWQRFGVRWILSIVHLVSCVSLTRLGTRFSCRDRTQALSIVNSSHFFFFGEYGRQRFARFST
jgi:hypothetical protein